MNVFVFLEARVLTPIEVGVVNRIVKRVVEDLEATLLAHALRLCRADVVTDINALELEVGTIDVETIVTY